MSEASASPIKQKLKSQIADKKSKSGFLGGSATKGKLSTNERLDFYSFIGTLVSKGKKLQDACTQIADTLDRQVKQKRFGGGDLKKSAAFYRDVAYQLRQGRRLSDILDKRVPVGEVLMVLAGERGDINKGLEAAEIEAKAARQVKDKLVSAVLYPSFLFLIVLGALKFVGTSLLPVVAQITDVSEWTDAQQSFYWISQNIIIWLPMFAVSIAGIGFAIAFVNRKVVGQPREAIQWLPPFNVIRHLTAANYLTTLSSLILAGESLKGALGKIRTNSTSNYLNYYVSSALARTRTGAVTRGPGAVIGDKLFTPWVMVKLEVFGDGDLESFTDRMAAISDEARENALNSVGGLTKLLNISMLIMAGFTVGFAVVTMYSIIGEVSSGGF